MTSNTPHFDDREQFKKDRLENINIQKITIPSWKDFSTEAHTNNYTYNFDWLGLPIIQTPQDIVALQEIIWETKPDIIIETGVARGGSLIFYASMLHMLNNKGKVIGIDIDIRAHNRKAIEEHTLSSYIHLIEGSSTDQNTVEHVKHFIPQNSRVMVILDSNHTHDHVLNELELYSPLVSKECYLVVLDTIVEDLPDDLYPNRPWGKGNNPKTAVHEFMKITKRFEIDHTITNKILLTAAPDGYLKCIE